MLKSYFMELIFMKMHTFFLGGSSPTGFRGPFGSVIADTDFHTYIIKGGPGTGKSSFMKKICSHFDDEERDLYLCSSDPDSADAVVLKKHKIIFVDGTAPHIFEPQYPGAVQEILNFGECWDSAKLKKQKAEIIAADAEYSQFHVRCRRFISAAASVIADTKQIGDNALDTEKLDRFIKRLAKKILPAKKDPVGKVFFKQISAITPKGYLTIPEPDDKIYLLNDSYFAGSDHFLRSFSEIAAELGYDTEVSVCTIYENELFEHMRIPSLNISFISANPVNKVYLDEKSPVNFMRFYSKEAVAAKKVRLRFNASAAADLIGEAVSCLQSAKAAHDKLEEFYISAINFDKVNKNFEKYLALIEND